MLPLLQFWKLDPSLPGVVKIRAVTNCLHQTLHAGCFAWCLGWSWWSFRPRLNFCQVHKTQKKYEKMMKKHRGPETCYGWFPMATGCFNNFSFSVTCRNSTARLRWSFGPKFLKIGQVTTNRNQKNRQISELLSIKVTFPTCMNAWMEGNLLIYHPSPCHQKSTSLEAFWSWKAVHGVCKFQQSNVAWTEMLSLCFMDSIFFWSPKSCSSPIFFWKKDVFWWWSCKLKSVILN